MLEGLRSICLKRQSTNNAAIAGPDLGTALLAPGVNAQPVQVATTQIVQEPQPAVVTPVEIITLPEPVPVSAEPVIEEPVEDEAAWNRRMRISAGLSAEQSPRQS